MVKHKGLVLNCFVQVVLCLLLLSCNAAKEQAKDTGKTAKKTSSPGELTFESLRIMYKKEMIESPDIPELGRIMDRLCDAAVSEGIVKGKNVREEMMVKFQDDPIGSCLFRLKYNEIQEATPENALSYCREVRKAYTEKKVGRAALMMELDNVKKTQADEIPTLCRELLEQKSSDGIRGIAYFARGQYYSDSGDKKRAALDWLRSSILDTGETVGKQKMLSIVDEIEKGGFSIESKILEKAGYSKDAENVLPFLLKGFLDVPDDVLDRNAPTTSLEAYCCFTPDLEKILSALNMEKESESSKAIMLGRLVYLEIRRKNPGKYADLNDKYARQVTSLLASKEADEDDLACLAFIQENICDCAVRLLGYDHQKWIAETMKAETGDGVSQPSTIRDPERGTGPKLTAVGLKDPLILAFEQTEREIAAARGPACYGAILDRKLAQYGQVEDNRSFISAIEDFIRTFPDSELGPEYLFKLADLQDRKWNSPDMAAKTIERIVDNYPNYKGIAKAQILRGRHLLDSKQYSEALVILEKCIADHPGEDVAMFAGHDAARCESLMGRKDACEKRLTTLIAEHPNHRLVPDILYLLGTTKMIRQDYVGAEKVLRDLVEAYPNSASARNASNALQGLRKNNQSSNQ